MPNNQEVGPRNRTAGTTAAPTFGGRGSFNQSVQPYSPAMSDAYTPHAYTGDPNAVLKSVAQAAGVAKEAYSTYRAGQIGAEADQVAQAAYEDRTGELSQQEAEQLAKSSSMFKKYAQARRQGALTGQAANIAVESEIKRVANQMPIIADDVRAAAHKELGFDPTGSQWSFLTEDHSSASQSWGDEMMDKAQSIAQFTGIAPDTVMTMMMNSQLNDLQLNQLKFNREAGKSTFSSTVQEANLMVTHTTNRMWESVLGDLEQEGADSISGLSPEQLAVQKANVRRIQQAQVQGMRQQLQSIPGSTATSIQASVDSVNSRYDQFVEGLDTFSSVDFAKKSAAEQKATTEMVVSGLFPLVTMGANMGVDDPLMFAQTLSDPNSKLIKNIAPYLPGVSLVKGNVQNLDKFMTKFRALTSGNAKKLLSTMGEEDAVGFAKAVAADAAKGDLSHETEMAGAFETLESMNQENFILDDIAESPQEYLNNQAATKYLKDSLSPAGISSMADELKAMFHLHPDALKGVVVKDGHLVVEADKSMLTQPTVAGVTSEIKAGFFNEGKIVDKINNYYEILGNKNMANTLSITKEQFLKRFNQSIKEEESTAETSVDSEEGDLASEIAVAATKYGIDPGLFSRMIKQESNMDPEAESSKGAVGLAQFVPDTAREYGLTVNENVDERKDPEKSLDASAHYYKDLLTKYNGDEVLALAAYNWGMGNVDKLLSGETPISKIPNETNKHVKIIMGQTLAQYLKRNNIIE